ncbi:YajG family lipoprotein [Oceanospirillaceae bacterium]|nr:YajG family lipoprotein [Oceanospirillaceae bacterium]
MKSVIFTLGLSLSVLISGCAVSPQSIVINPQVAASGPAYGQGRALLINVDDRRSSAVLGSRGGVYETSSLITISNDINGALLLAAQSAAAQLGFDGTSSAKPATLTLALDELIYDTQTQSLINTVTIIAKITLTTTIGSSTHTGHYQTERSHKLPQLPDAQKNQDIISEALSTSLERGFSDISLANFLAKN